MLKRKRRTIFLICGVIILLISSLFTAKKIIESEIDTTWLQYENPEDAGWSSTKLKEARKYYDSLGSTSAMVIHDGKILLSWGDVTKVSNVHSVRKSFLSALYGIHLELGHLDIEKSLHQLGIYDHLYLSELEGESQVKDLMASSSGVYLRAGEESIAMRWARPSRGSHLPGTHFYYNNWDFNVLGSIFNQQTGTDLFVEFMEKIAQPLGMEDFSIEDTVYKVEERRSVHPSYLFRMSTRDMARFGQLYLQQGEWEGEQIIPKEWIKESTSIQSAQTSSEIYGYGYMWWVANSGYFQELGLYSAVGRYGQSIDIIPEKNLVFVHRVDSDYFLN